MSLSFSTNNGDMTGEILEDSWFGICFARKSVKNVVFVLQNLSLSKAKINKGSSPPTTSIYACAIML